MYNTEFKTLMQFFKKTFRNHDELKIGTEKKTHRQIVLNNDSQFFEISKMFAIVFEIYFGQLMVNHIRSSAGILPCFTAPTLGSSCRQFINSTTCLREIFLLQYCKEFQELHSDFHSTVSLEINFLIIYENIHTLFVERTIVY